MILSGGILILVVLGVWRAVAVEEARYRVQSRDGDVEVREYEAQVLAEVVVDSEMEAAGNRAFRLLFDYISGANRSRTRIPMTAPVGQEAAGEKIAMTAPVGQTRAAEGWAVSFMMPAGMTMETTPEPVDPRVRIRVVPPRRVAALRYSGSWNEDSWRRQLARLQDWLVRHGLRPAGPAIWARYNPPMMPAFLRRNEVLIPLVETGL